jgi:hypothetical protein
MVALVEYWHGFYLDGCGSDICLHDLPELTTSSYHSKNYWIHCREAGRIEA